MPLYINNSALRLLSECETKFWVQFHKQRAMHDHKIGAMEVGQYFHMLFESLLLTRTCDYKACWDSIFHDEVPQEEKYSYSNILNIAMEWKSRIVEWLQEVEVVGKPEEYFEIPFGTIFGEEVIYYGTRDARINWKGKHYLVDLKTSGSIDESSEILWRMSSQLKGYTWAAKEQGFDDIQGVIIPAVEIRKVPPYDGKLDKKCSVHKTKYAECQHAHIKTMLGGPFSFSKHQLKQWKADTEQLIGRAIAVRSCESLNAVTMDGTWKWPGCSRCQYQRWCEAERPVEALTQIMVHKEWKRGSGNPDHKQAAIPLGN